MTAGDRWPDDAALRGFVDRILAELEGRGWPREAAQTRLRQDAWWPVLQAAGGTVLAMCTPADVAREVERETPCGVCGHPLHRAVGDVRLPVAGRLRLVRRLPHIAPCSCGYADRALDAPVAEALRRHFTGRPDEGEVDAATPEFAAEVRRAREAGGPGG